MNDNKNKNTTIIMPPYSNNSSDWTSTSSSTTSSSSRGTSKPKSALHLTSPSSSKNSQQQHQQNDLLQLAAQELETMKQPKQHQQLSQKIPTQEQSFPPPVSVSCPPSPEISPASTVILERTYHGHRYPSVV